MTPWDQVLQIGFKSISPILIPFSEREKIASFLRLFPESVGIRGLLFETPLKKGSSGTDLSMLFRFVEPLDSFLRAPPQELQTSAWKILARFFKQTEDLPIYHKFGLEFDLASQQSHSPNLFLYLPKEPSRALHLLEELFPLVVVKRAVPAVIAQMRAIAESFAEEMRFFLVGIMLGRSLNGLRLGVKARPSMVGLVSFFSSLHLPFKKKWASLLEEIFPLIPSIIGIQLDVGEVLQGRIGLEIFDVPNWEPILDRLQGYGLISTDQSNALLSYENSKNEAPLWILPDRICRRISHIKLVCERDQFYAKAYYSLTLECSEKEFYQMAEPKEFKL